MFKTRVALNLEAHGDLRFEPDIGYRFAANLMLVPGVASEAKVLARDYVLIFDRAQPVFHVLLGLRENHNAYVNDKGQWLGRYRPALIRAYPFTAVRAAGEAEAGTDGVRYVVMIDPDAPQFQDSEGERFFDSDGRPTALLEKVQKVLMSLENDKLLTQQLVSELDEAGLLVERHIQAKGSDLAVTGFRVIDTEALGKLSAEVLARLRDTGALMLAYAQIFSLSNLSDSPLSWSLGQDQKAAPDSKVKSLFEDDSDVDLSFLN